jgi:hypothetical protein
MQQPEPDAEELCARLRGHLAEVLRQLDQPLPRPRDDMVIRRGGWLIDHGKGTVTRRQAMRAQRRNKRMAASP